MAKKKKVKDYPLFLYQGIVKNESIVELAVYKRQQIYQMDYKKIKRTKDVVKQLRIIARLLNTTIDNS